MLRFIPDLKRSTFQAHGERATTHTFAKECGLSLIRVQAGTTASDRLSRHPHSFYMLFFDQTYRVNRQAFNQIFRLTPEEVENPLLVLKEYFSKCDLAEIRSTIYNVKRVALTSENTEFFEPVERGNLMFDLERIEQVLEAAYLIAAKEKKKEKKRKKG